MDGGQPEPNGSSVERGNRAGDEVESCEGSGAANAGEGEARRRMKTTIVLARIENTGLRDTGRVEMKNANWFPVFETVPEAKALVYSSNVKELARAKEFAATEGYQVFVLPDTGDVLSVAKAKILKGAKP